jgi:hypothetical protein
MAENAPVDREETRGDGLRTGALLLVAAAVTGAPAQMLHPLPEPHQPESFAPIVASSDAWIWIHLLALLAYTLTGWGLVLLLRSFVGTRADVLARLGTVSATVGVAVATVWMTSDGIATKHLVDLWAAAPEADAETLYFVARGFEELNLALFFITMVLVFGVPILLSATAMLRSRMFPLWLAALGAVTASATILIGLVQVFTGRTVLWTHVLTPLAVVGVSVWSVLTAVLMWRMGGAVRARTRGSSDAGSTRTIG